MKIQDEDKSSVWFWLGIVIQIGFWTFVFFGLLLVWILKLEVTPFRYVEF